MGRWTLVGVMVVTAAVVIAFGRPTVVTGEARPTETCAFRDTGLSLGSAAAAEAHDLAVLSDRDVWAVGAVHVGAIWDLDEQPAQPLIVHWDGRAWKRHRVGGANMGEFWAVAASSPRNVWVLGSNGSSGGTAVLRWDGRRWRQLLTTRQHWFEDLRAFAADDVWIVGRTKDEPYRPVMKHWDGRRWRNLRAGVARGALFLSTARNARDVWFAGYSEDEATGRGQALVVRWDGYRLRRVSPPSGRYPNVNVEQLGMQPPRSTWLWGTSENDKDPRWDSDYDQVRYWFISDGRSWRPLTNRAEPPRGLSLIKSARGGGFLGASEQAIYRWRAGTWTPLPRLPRTPQRSGPTIGDLAWSARSAIWVSADYMDNEANQNTSIYRYVCRR